MLPRRTLLLAPLAAALAGAAVNRPARAQQGRSRADPLRLGVDTALADSGLARALQQAFGRDTGLAVLLVPKPALALLDALERGEVDAGLCNAPEAETKLEQQGLVHDRQPVARADFVIVGPGGRGKAGDPARIGGGRDAAQALQRLRDAALAAPGTITFLTANDGSGAHAAEQALWRAAKVAPVAPWFVAAEPGGALIRQVQARGAYALVERGAWVAQGGAPLAVLVEGDPALVEQVHVMRSFRVSHAAGKLFVDWVAGPKGHRVVATVRGYRAP